MQKGMESIMELVATRLLSSDARAGAAAEPELHTDGSFFAEWERAGGRACFATLRAALRALAARDGAALALPARALQDFCWERLHSGHWSGVGVAWRDAYSLAALLAAASASATADGSGSGDGGRGLLLWALKQLDLAAMMGGPRFRAAVDAAIALASAAAAAAAPGSGAAGGGPGESAPPSPLPPLLLTDALAPPVRLPPGALSDASRRLTPIAPPPSLERFMVDYLLAPGGGRPAVIRGAIDDWPALTRWRDARYLERVAGARTVPVEVGPHYLDPSWGTRLMTLSEFLRAHIFGGGGGSSCSGGGAGGSDNGSGSSTQRQQQQQPRGYLAQHELLAQIPELANDIAVPDYVAAGDAAAAAAGGGDSDGSDDDGGGRAPPPPAVNAWLGPVGTVTPAHTDPRHNLFAQVVGTKYVRLLPPSAGAALRPHESGPHRNTARVDVGAPPDTPEYASAPFFEAHLEAGDLLFIPRGWWHYVVATSASFSVSFWWG